MGIIIIIIIFFLTPSQYSLFPITPRLCPPTYTLIFHPLHTIDDFTSKWSRFSLKPKETQTVPLTSNPTGDDKVLVAKFFTKRRLNKEAVFWTLKNMWKTEKSFDIRDLGSNTVMILFDDEFNLDHILMWGPWSFDKYLLGLYKPRKNEAIKNAKFDRESFWVQVHDLPIQHMSKANAEAIGSTLGIVEQVDTGPTRDCRGRCLRARINVDISQPLCRGRMVDIGDSSPSWVSFQDERMPIFCYWCGILNHDEKDCKLWIHSKDCKLWMHLHWNGGKYEIVQFTPNAITVISLKDTHVLDGPHNGSTDASEPAIAQNF